MGACDFLQLHDLFLRPLVAFFRSAWQARKVIQVKVTRAPPDAWVARTAAGGDPLWRTSTLADASS